MLRARFALEIRLALSDGRRPMFRGRRRQGETSIPGYWMSGGLSRTWMTVQK